MQLPVQYLPFEQHTFVQLVRLFHIHPRITRTIGRECCYFSVQHHEAADEEESSISTAFIITSQQTCNTHLTVHSMHGSNLVATTRRPCLVLGLYSPAQSLPRGPLWLQPQTETGSHQTNSGMRPSTSPPPSPVCWYAFRNGTSQVGRRS